MAGILDFIRGYFRRGDKAQPRPGDAPPLPGDFGTPQKGEKREKFDAGMINDFSSNRLVLWVSSSWVEYGLYHPDRKELEIGYNDGWVGFYSPASPELARSFATAGSKGGWVHQHLKAGYNGRKWIHKLNYRHK